MEQAAQANNQELQQLQSRFINKSDFYKYLYTVLQVFLPRKRQCSLQHLQDLVTNRKRFYSRREVNNL